MSSGAEDYKQLIRDNDVYLMSPEMWTAFQRYTAGEIYDFDGELDRILVKRPYLFSAHFWSGLVKVRRVMIAPGLHEYDQAIQDRFGTCIEKARRAGKTKQFHTAGMFYEMMCEAGLGMYNGIRGNYLKAHGNGRRGMELLDKVLKARPNLHAALLVKGMYNFYTGRFGVMTRLLMRLMGMTPGDKVEGLRQITRAIEEDSPVHYFTGIYAVYAFAPLASQRTRALRVAEEMVKRYPNNYYPYLLRGYVYEKKGKFKKARTNYRQGRRLLKGPPEAYKDIIHVSDIFLLDVRIHFITALYDRDDDSLRWLQRWGNNRQARYADAPLIANMYLGHLYSYARLDEQSLKFYKKMQSFPDAEWMKDLGKKYEKLPMRRRRPKSKKITGPLKPWLLKHPEIKA